MTDTERQRLKDDLRREANVTLQQKIEAATPSEERAHQRALQKQMLRSNALSGREMSGAEKRLRSEVTGEMGAAHALRNHPELAERYKDYTLVQGFEQARPQGFDQVYANPAGDVLIIEAKGGAGRQGITKTRGAQLSEQWVTDVSQRMGGESGEKVQAALRDGKKVEGVFVQYSPTFGGEPATILKGNELRGISSIDDSGVISYGKPKTREPGIGR